MKKKILLILVIALMPLLASCDDDEDNLEKDWYNAQKKSAEDNSILWQLVATSLSFCAFYETRKINLKRQKLL